MSERPPARQPITVTVVTNGSHELVDLLTDVLAADRFRITAVPGRADDVARIADGGSGLMIVDLPDGSRDGHLTAADFLALARAHPALRPVPTIVLTIPQRAGTDGRDGALDGALRLEKPFSLDGFEAAVRSALDRQVPRRRRRQ